MTPPLLPQHPAYDPAPSAPRRDGRSELPHDAWRMPSLFAGPLMAIPRAAQLPLALRTRDGRLLPEPAWSDAPPTDAAAPTLLVRDRAQLSLFVR